MQILEESKKILEDNGYAVSLISKSLRQFEDDTLLGFVCESSLPEILDTWSIKQDQFIRDNASYLRVSALKSWNLYCVFLSSDPVTEGVRKAVTTIEEDFRATRKIVQAGITTISEVTRALYPFIPIQNIVSLGTEDLKQKVRSRLTELPSGALEALLDQTKDERSTLAAFQEAYEIKRD